MPWHLEHSARSQALDHGRSLVGHRRIETPLARKGEGAPPDVVTAAIGLDRQRDGHIPTGLGEQDVSPGQQSEHWPEPAVPTPDLVHRSVKAHPMTSVGAKELISERSGEAVAIAAQNGSKRAGSSVGLVVVSGAGALPRGPHGAHPIETGTHRPGPSPAERDGHATGAAPLGRARA